VDKELMRQYIRGLDKEQLIALFIRHMQPREEPVKIPVSIFNAKLTAFESVVKYMREELQYSNAKVALLLIRSPQTVWLTYRNAKKKHPQKLTAVISDHDLPMTIFATNGSIFAATVKYLKDQGVKNQEIARLLKRNVKTITTVYYRAKKREIA
jgi:hypothetical protein